MVLGLAGCSEDPTKKSDGVMTFAEYDAASENTTVVVETYVQDKQSWWDNKATLYTQDADGGYFIYNADMSEEDYNKLETGTKIKVTGVKSSWSGEVEIVGSTSDTGATVEIEKGKWVAEPFDCTDSYSNEAELLKHQNQKVCFKGVKVLSKKDADGVDHSFLYNWDGSGEAGTDADLYFDCELNGQVRTFVCEYYLRNENTDAYKAIQGLQIGNMVDIEGFMYWYNGPQVHVTSVTASK